MKPALRAPAFHRRICSSNPLHLASRTLPAPALPLGRRCVRWGGAVPAPSAPALVLASTPALVLLPPRSRSPPLPPHSRSPPHSRVRARLPAPALAEPVLALASSSSAPTPTLPLASPSAPALALPTPRSGRLLTEQQDADGSGCDASAGGSLVCLLFFGVARRLTIFHICVSISQIHVATQLREH